MSKKQKKSPLKKNPLRTPGQSLDEEIQKILDEEVLPYILFPIIMILFAFWDWLIWLHIIKIPNPVLMTIVVIGISIYCFFKIIKLRKKIRAYRLGRDGERAVGQTLDNLKNSGYKIFHDLIGDNFNLDHLIVCEHGIFSIETKTYLKPEKGECRIVFDEDGLSINGYKSGKKIINQVKAQKKWIENKVFNLTGIKTTVKPVIVFPGWYIENRIKRSDIWILEPKALPTYIANSPKILPQDKVKLISNHISNYIRTTYNKEP